MKEIVQPAEIKDIQALLKSLDKHNYIELRDYNIILLMLDTGIRTSELTAITNEDYNPEVQSILIRPDVAKTSRSRILYLSPIPNILSVETLNGSIQKGVNKTDFHEPLRAAVHVENPLLLHVYTYFFKICQNDGCPPGICPCYYMSLYPLRVVREVQFYKAAPSPPVCRPFSGYGIRL